MIVESTETSQSIRPAASASASSADQIRHRQRRGSRGGRPPAFDAETYRGRNVVERSFNLLKQWRALATRYDKHATIYRGAVVLAAIVAWLRS